MQCQKCGVEMKISDFRCIGNDKIEQDLTCRSKQCSNYGVVVSTITNDLDIMPVEEIPTEILEEKLEEIIQEIAEEITPEPATEPTTEPTPTE